MTDPQDDPDVLRAAGHGAECFDDPALFFLTYEEPIRRWKELSKRARAATEEYLLTLKPDLEMLGAGKGLELDEGDSRRWHHLFLKIPDTPDSGGNPVIAYAFGWKTGQFRMTESSYLTPFVAIRTGQDDLGQRARQLLQACDDGFIPSERDRRRMLGKGDREWPVWEKVVAKPQWWTDLESYREQVVTALGNLIEWSESCLRQVVAELNDAEART